MFSQSKERTGTRNKEQKVTHTLQFTAAFDLSNLKRKGAGLKRGTARHHPALILLLVHAENDRKLDRKKRDKTVTRLTSMKRAVMVRRTCVCACVCA